MLGEGTVRKVRVPRSCWDTPVTAPNRIGAAVKSDDIEACQRLYFDKKLFVKFSKLKLCQQVLQVKKEMKNIDPSEFDFVEGTAIFIHEILCSYYKMLWNKFKMLWEEKLIQY